MKRTFVDTGVLIAAFRGEAEIRRRAIEVLDDPQRILLSSDPVRLEVLPKPNFHRQTREVEFLTSFFDSLKANLAMLTDTNRAYEIAMRYGLSALDALHVQAAIECEADELVTAEKPFSSLHRVKEIVVLSIFPVAS